MTTCLNYVKEVFQKEMRKYRNILIFKKNDHFFFQSGQKTELVHPRSLVNYKRNKYKERKEILQT